MTKKIIIAVLTLCLVAIIVFGYLFLRKQNNVQQQPLVQAIPLNASVILVLHNPQTLFAKQLTDSKLWQNLRQVAPWAEADSCAGRWLEYIARATAQKDKQTERQVYLSWHANGTGRFELLYVLALHNQLEVEQCPKVLAQYFPDLGAQTSVLYDNETIYSQPIPKGKLSFAIINNQLIASASQTLVEQSILQQHSHHSLLDDAQFAPLWKTTTHSAALNLFINLRNSPQFINTFGAAPFKQLADANGTFAAWAELDATIGADHCLLNGFIGSSANDYLHLFVSQKPIDIRLPRFMPASTAQLLLFGVSKPELFVHELDGYLTSTNQAEAWHAQQQALNDTCGFDATAQIAGLINGEFAWVQTNDAAIDSLNQQFFIMAVQSESLAFEKMAVLVDSFAARNNIAAEQLHLTSNIDDETSLRILRMPLANIPACILGCPFNQIAAEYCTTIDNYLLFGHSPEALTKYVHTVMLKKTLYNDAAFHRFTSNLDNSGNLLFFTNLPLSVGNMKQWLNEEIASQLENDADVYGKTYGLGLQITGGSDLLYTDLLIGEAPNFDNDQSRATWETMLDTSLGTQPVMVPVHDSPDQLLFLQDLRNTLYCINKAGRVLWKKQIDGPILSPFSAIDYYRNKKTQYLFSTAKRLYAIDKLGNFVERYPIDLPATAAASMAVFDYDKRREYRILVPGTDKKLYLFDVDGRVLKDWNSPQTDNPVTNAVQHFRIQDKDFLVLADKHNIYFLNRRGETRLQPQEKFQKSANNRFYQLPGATPALASIVTTNEQGTVYRVFFDGRVEKQSFANFSPQHFFAVADFDGDGTADYLFVDEYKMIVYDVSKDILFSYNFNHPIRQAPQLFDTKTETIVGVVDGEGNEINLFHADGSQFKNFPLPGKTAFCINAFNPALNSINLIIGGTDNNLFNYEIQIP